VEPESLVYSLDCVTTLLASALEPQLNPLTFLAWFGGLSGIYIFGQGILILRRRHGAQVSPVSAIRDAGPGLLQVCGSAEGYPTLSAAVSGKPCFYYRATVWRQEDAAEDDSWKNVAEETRSKAFVLNDSTGRILVDPRGAEVDWPRDTYEEYGKTLLATHTDIPVALEEFLARNNVKTGAALRVEEYLISPGAEVFVYGMKAGNKDFRAATSLLSPARKDSPAAPPPVSPQVIQLSPAPRVVPAVEMTMQSRVAAALTLARANPSGSKPTGPFMVPSISVAVQEPVARHEEQPKKPAAIVPPPFVLRQPQDGSPFTISYRGHPATASYSSGKAVALLLAGILLTLTSAHFLLLKFGGL
jgi:hypothetical protein